MSPIWSEELMMEVGAADNYQKGLRYLSVGRRMHVAARQLDHEDADTVRKVGDVISARGLALLKAAVGPRRARGGRVAMQAPPMETDDTSETGGE